ncbi:hypothetical protein L207DRAFT_591276 [Hyaloscypha variabilis F]|uniref:Uncharacterized protein n=1 Tax=Hyaloscypha variabilis (strain UAMH 11265 / GT02V1 / F) TaxID=1149755 RepID=A0A2J6R019_HYAVF|nr:hypothetical protein L207DRAFT_591276 [Hyaloscypha variabilis F]
MTSARGCTLERLTSFRAKRKAVSVNQLCPAAEAQQEPPACKYRMELYLKAYRSRTCDLDPARRPLSPNSKSKICEALLCNLVNTRPDQRQYHNVFVHIKRSLATPKPNLKTTKTKDKGEHADRNTPKYLAQCAMHRSTKSLSTMNPHLKHKKVSWHIVPHAETHNPNSDRHKHIKALQSASPNDNTVFVPVLFSTLAVLDRHWACPLLGDIAHGRCLQRGFDDRYFNRQLELSQNVYRVQDTLRNGFQQCLTLTNIAFSTVQGRKVVGAEAANLQGIDLGQVNVSNMSESAIVESVLNNA